MITGLQRLGDKPHGFQSDQSSRLAVPLRRQPAVRGEERDSNARPRAAAEGNAGSGCRRGRGFRFLRSRPSLTRIESPALAVRGEPARRGERPLDPRLFPVHPYGRQCSKAYVTTRRRYCGRITINHHRIRPQGNALALEHGGRIAQSLSSTSSSGL